ncbi:nucleoside recognition protein [Paenibacillus oenotherae]|uniref:Nucleoside recognition protein n=1 Tax=Paenibacillus oenotherae TaxID=1435645 RepID=A0ABS7D0P1_9BACL|nr:nucleoside recognition domain-containing protein [Paenibacillus oenotherae]MBW7473495.1 nucleoside recognition protein [Paenibacillus oenotherae]
MVNWIWLFFIVASFIAAAVTGRMEALTEAAFDGAKSGVTVSFGLISVMVFWLGLMRIAEDARLLDRMAVLLQPVVRFLFPDVPRNHPALGYIMSNMSANILGLGNAATPMGIKAMQELQKLNPDKETASAAMCTLLALNTSSITLVPTTLIAIRMTYSSAHPAEIVGTTLAATLIATAAAIAADRWYRHRSGKPPQWKDIGGGSGGAGASGKHGGAGGYAAIANNTPGSGKGEAVV